MVRFLLTVVLLLMALTMIDATFFYLYFSNSCVNFTFPDDSVARELCYSGVVIQPDYCVATSGVTYLCGDLPKATYTFKNEYEGMEASIEWGYYNDTYNGSDLEVISNTIWLDTVIVTPCHIPGLGLTQLARGPQAAVMPRQTEKVVTLASFAMTGLSRRTVLT
jgi:hypothetical protein